MCYLPHQEFKGERCLCLCRPEVGGQTWPRVSSSTGRSWLQHPDHYSPNCGFSSPGHTVSMVHFVEAGGLKVSPAELGEQGEKLKRRRKEERVHVTGRAESQKAGLLSCIGGREFLSTLLSILKADLQWLPWPTYRSRREARQILPGKKTAEQGFYYQISMPRHVGLSLALPPGARLLTYMETRQSACESHAHVGLCPSSPARQSNRTSLLFSLVSSGF